MTEASVYLDHNATTPPTAEVVAAMLRLLSDTWANPSSVHRAGQAARREVELARAKVAQLIGARPAEIIFTSGGTEANNLALRGSLESGGIGPRVLLTTRLEHAAVRDVAAVMEKRGVAVVYLPTNPHGELDVAETLALVQRAMTQGQTPGAIPGEEESGPEGPGLGRGKLPGAIPGVVSVQWANNETGVIQPVAELAEGISKLRAAGLPVRLHVDATQAVGKLPVDVKRAEVDLLTLAGHKFHGPKGVGALYVRSGVKLVRQNIGGPQERDRRGGTENTPGIAGLGVAAELAQRFLADTAGVERLRGLRDRLEAGIRAACPEAVVNAAGAKQRLWNTTNIAFPRLEAEAILLGLSERGVYASAGAACSSGSLDPSPVLLAMGLPRELAHGSVRFSLGRGTTEAEIDRAIPLIGAVVARLRRTLPGGAA